MKKKIIIMVLMLVSTIFLSGCPFFWHPEGATVTYVVGSWLVGGLLIIMCLYLHISIYFDDRIIRENEEYYQKMQSGMEIK